MAAPTETFHTNCEPLKNHKHGRKLLKKLNAITYKLKKDGIELSPQPSQFLCVSNAGLGNGVSFESVKRAFSNHGDIASIVMLPGKPYAFVSYENTISAERAQLKLNGSTLCINADPPKSVVIYVSFVTKVPPSVTPSTDYPDGLVLLDDYISVAQEAELLEYFTTDDTNHSCGRELKHRQVQHFGYEFVYGSNSVDASCPISQPIPTVCDYVIEHLLMEGHIKHRPDQLTVNRYLPGQGIPSHIDTKSAFEDGITSLSLGSQTVMEFRHPDGRQVSVLLPRRSVLVMTGASRYVWSHGITPRKFDIVISDEGGLTLQQRDTRVSLTFRKLARTSTASDARSDKASLPSTNIEAINLEMNHVHEVYSEIAHHYSATRHTPWPLVAHFIHHLPPATLLLDVGCGNGKYFGLNSDIYEIGCERGLQLANICSGRGHEVCVGDALSIPLRTDVVDACICIAVLHHLSTRDRRMKALEEITRVVRPGGQIMIQVWAMEQKWGDVSSKYVSRSSVKVARVNCLEWSPVFDCVYGEDDVGSGQEVTVETVGWSGEEVESDEVCCRESSGLDSEVVEACGGIKWSEMDELPKKEEDTDFKTDTSAVRGNEGIMEDTGLLKVHKNRTAFQQRDLLVPWHLKGGKHGDNADDTVKTFYRFYHIFEQGELEGMCANIEGIKVDKVYYDEGNWCVICQKESS